MAAPNFQNRGPRSLPLGRTLVLEGPPTGWSLGLGDALRAI